MVDYFVNMVMKLDVRGSVHRNIIHIENPTNATVYQNFISYLYEAQHVLGNTRPIIRSLKLHQQPLDLHTWKVVGHVVARMQNQRQLAQF